MQFKRSEGTWATSIKPQGMSGNRQDDIATNHQETDNQLAKARHCFACLGQGCRQPVHQAAVLGGGLLPPLFFEPYKGITDY
jgi:hypothetical protein